MFQRSRNSLAQQLPVSLVPCVTVCDQVLLVLGLLALLFGYLFLRLTFILNKYFNLNICCYFEVLIIGII